MNDAEIFLAAAQIEDLQVRSAFLDSVCQAGEGQKQRIVEKLEKYGRWQDSFEAFPEKLPDRLIELQSETSSISGGTAFPDRVLPGTEFPRTAIRHLADSSEASARRQPGERLGAYELLKFIGAGGMGEVYLARDHRLNRNVALKVLPHKYSQSTSWVLRFEQEARAASALNHPNILTVHEIGKADDCHFMATEFIAGETLRGLVGREIEVDRKLDIALQIVEALSAAHAANIVHRDIKPENVMVRRDGLVKVLDFGIAKQQSDSSFDSSGFQSGQAKLRTSLKTEPGLLMGTVRYMAPEQIRHMPIDIRADLFSFGLVLFELLTGLLPYKSNDDSGIVSELLGTEMMQFQRLSNSVPAELDHLLRKLLRRDREERYQTAKEVLVDLRQIRRSLQRSEEPLVSFTPPLGSVGPEEVKTGSTTSSDTQFEAPGIRYATSGNVNIAYQLLGKGDIDLVFVMGWVSHLDWFWKEPSFARFLNRLASFARLIVFDKRGTGLSDRVPHDQLPTLEQRMDDVRAVMDAVGSDRAVLCGVSEGGPLCSLFAATYPQKTLALVMMGSYARRLQSEDYPWGPTVEQHQVFLDDIQRNWGGPVGIETRAPSRMNDPDFRNWWATYLRMGASPGAALALTRMNSQIDIRPILKTIQVPTLVLHRTGDQCLRVEEGRFLAEQISGAKFVELPGSDHLPFVGNQDHFIDAIAHFLTGVQPNERVDRILATVLWVQVVPGHAANDARLLELLQAHFEREIDLFRGKGVLSNSKRSFATFDGPARAIRAAAAVRDSAKRLGVDIRVGLHTGECEISPNSATGPAVELAQRVAEFAQVNEVCVSSTVKDLVAGSGIQFTHHSIARLSDEVTHCNLFQVRAS